MRFYITFKGVKSPSNKNYVIVEAACEATAIDKLQARGWKGWSGITTNPRYIRRQGLTLWAKI